MFIKLCLCIYFVYIITISSSFGRPQLEDDDDRYMHQIVRSRRQMTQNIFHNNLVDEEEQTADYWRIQAQKTVKSHLNRHININVAKNIILFLGDGMSVPTLAAARIYYGQLKGQAGENSHLFFETFPFTGLSQTYCVDKQVADSACSATAYLCGIKANQGTIGITAAVERNDCPGMNNTKNHVDSIAKWAQNAGKSTGIVTTTRVTHASPAGTYAHTSNRDWESDTNILSDRQNPKVCQDIASQLVKNEPGSKFNVILGGGRKKLLPNTVIDEEGKRGERYDGQNLIKQWQNNKKASALNYRYVWNREQLFDAVKDPKLNSLLGLFESDHCQYHLDANPKTEPTLAEMTEAAIKVLNRSDNGFFLFVEGGRIDHGHHETKTHKAIDETVQLSEAVQRAVDLVNLDETLIVVTSDHAHTMTLSGYPDRGNDILSVTGNMDNDQLPMATLSYANGPGFKPMENGKRHNVSTDNMSHKDYQFPAMQPTVSETHGGDDVGVFAVGPWSHMFTGMYEQNVIPHLMAFASCIGNGLKVCDINQYF